MVFVSNWSGPTVEPAPHGAFGPGLAFVYQPAASIVGFVSVIGVELYEFAQIPEPVPLVGTPCWLQMMSFHPWKLIWQPPTTVADASRFADVPTGELLLAVRNFPPTYIGIVPPALVDGSAISGEPPPERHREPAV